jgi:hypothetical protein
MQAAVLQLVGRAATEADVLRARSDLPAARVQPMRQLTYFHPPTRSQLMTFIPSFAQNPLPALYCLVAYLLPSLYTSRTLTHPSPSTQIQWLSYWSILTILELLIFPLLSATYSKRSLYCSLIKILTTFALSHPPLSGATLVYSKFLSPLFLSIEPQVDEYNHLIKTSVSKFFWNFITLALKVGGGGIVAGVGGVVNVFRGGGGGGGLAASGSSGNSLSSSSSSDSLDGGSSSSSSSAAGSRRLNRTASSSIRDGLSSKEIEGDKFVEEFVQLLGQGLFVFVKLRNERRLEEEENTEGGGRTALRILSYAKEVESFLISSVDDEDDAVRLPVRSITSLIGKGGTAIEVVVVTEEVETTVVEIILSDEGDRDVLLEGFVVLRENCRTE